MRLRQIIRALQRSATSTTEDASSDTGIIFPSRAQSSNDPLALSPVFRAVQILQTAVSSLPVVQLKNGHHTTLSRIVARPDIAMSRSNFLSETVAALALDGNAFWLKQFDAQGNVINIKQLPPQQVTVVDKANNLLAPQLTYHYGRYTFSADDIIHLKFMAVPGRVRGLGAISAARLELDGASQAREYRANWFNDAHQPSGILSSDEDLDPEEARVMKETFKRNVKNGDVAVLGHKMSYDPIALKPEDMQYLETIKFDTVQIARLMGVPASLMLASIDGSNLTYSNIEQEWVQFADFTLAAYTDDIADAFTSLTPNGNVVRFEWDSMRRSDTSTRVSTYAQAISAGIMTVNEARAGLGLEPIEETAQIGV